MSSSESKRSPQDNQHHQNLSIDELLPNLYDWDENLVAIADPFDIALEGLNTTTTTTTTERVEHPPAGSETIIWKQSVVVKPSGPLQRLDVANAMMKIRGARGSNTKRASKTTRANPPPPNKVSSTSQQAGEGSSASSSSKKKKKEKTSSKYRGVTKRKWVFFLFYSYCSKDSPTHVVLSLSFFHLNKQKIATLGSSRLICGTLM